MSIQPEDEQLKQEGEKTKEQENPEEVARKAAQGAKEREVVAVLVKAEEDGGGVEAPVAESAEKDMEARAREIAQKYLETIPEEDRKFNSPKEVESVLLRLADTYDLKDHLFSNADKYGNAPTHILELRYDRKNKNPKKEAAGWREFAADPIGVAKETDKVMYIANSTLSESVRKAMLLIILKEGEHSAIDMAVQMAEKLEQGEEYPDLPKEHHDQNRSTPDKLLRQKAFRYLLEGLYPDLMQREDVKFWIDFKCLDYNQHHDKDTVIAMVERYSQLFGGDTLFIREHGGAKNSAEMIAKLKSGEIMAYKASSGLNQEIRNAIAKKVASTETK